MRKEHHLQFNAIERKMYFLKILKTQASFVIRSGSMWVGATNGRFLDRCIPLLLTVCFKEFIKKNKRSRYSNQPGSSQYMWLKTVAGGGTMQFCSLFHIFCISCLEQMDAKELATKVICIQLLTALHQRINASLNIYIISCLLQKLIPNINC